jgi:hypothetical protein
MYVRPEGKTFVDRAPELLTTRVAMDCPLRTGSTVGFQAMIALFSLSKMNVDGAVVAPTVIGKLVVGFDTIPVGAAAGGGDWPGGSGIVTVNGIFTFHHKA